MEELKIEIYYLKSNSDVKVSYSDGCDIYLYLFSLDIDEDNVIVELNWILIHELVHILEPDLNEIEVLRAGFTLLE